MAKQKPRSDESPRSGRARAVGDLVGDVGGVAFKRFGFVQSAIVSRWAEIVGERYAKVSLPESIRFPAGKKSSGTLTLLVEGAHSPLLQHLTPLITERVNRFFGYEAVNKIAFRQGRPAPSAPAPKRPDLARCRRNLAKACDGSRIQSFAPVWNRLARDLPLQRARRRSIASTATLFPHHPE